MNLYWGWFLTGSVGSAAIKVCRYMERQRPGNHSFWRALGRWFIGEKGDKAPAYTTICTIGFCWITGAAYIERFEVPMLMWLTLIPLYAGFALFLGALSEAVWGFAFKLITNRILGGK